jgi:hypothetical protein
MLASSRLVVCYDVFQRIMNESSLLETSHGVAPQNTNKFLFKLTYDVNSSQDKLEGLPWVWGESGYAKSTKPRTDHTGAWQ